MRVQAYRNLNRGGYSIMSLEPGTYGTVIDHSDEVVILNPQFVVQPAGRKRVIKQGRKNVHAFVRGELSDSGDATAATERVSYNPFRAGTFMDEHGKPVYTGSKAVLSANGCRFGR